MGLLVYRKTWCILLYVNMFSVKSVEAWTATQHGDLRGSGPVCYSLHATQHIDLLSVFHSINSIRVSGSWFLSLCMSRRGQVTVTQTAECVLNLWWRWWAGSVAILRAPNRLADMPSKLEKTAVVSRELGENKVCKIEFEALSFIFRLFSVRITAAPCPRQYILGQVCCPGADSWLWQNVW